MVVTAVDPSSDAGQKGFQRGDIILSVNFRAITTAAELSAAVTQARTTGRQNVLLSVQRGNRPATNIPVRIAAR